MLDDWANFALAKTFTGRRGGREKRMLSFLRLALPGLNSFSARAGFGPAGEVRDPLFLRSSLLNGAFEEPRRPDPGYRAPRAAAP